KEKSYEVTGFVTMPYYVSFERGQTNIGDGSIDYYGFIAKQDFTLDDITDLFIKTKESDDFMSYSEEYEAYHGPMEAKIDEFGETAMARETSALAKELQDGKDELLEEKTKAEKEIADAEQELNDAEIKISDGEQELKDNIVKYTKEFEDGRQEIKDGKEALEKGKEEYSSGYASWLEGYNKYQDGKAELIASKAQLDGAKNQLDQGQRELNAAKTQLDEGAEQMRLLESVLVGIRDIQAGLPEGPTITEEQYLQIIADIRIFSPEIAQIIENGIPYTDPNFLISLRMTLEQGVNELVRTLENAKTSYQTGLLQYEAGQAALAENKVKYEAGLKEYQQGEQLLISSKKEIDQGKLDLEAADREIKENETKLIAAEKELDEGEEEFNQTIQDTREELAEAKIDLREGRETFQREKKDAQEKIAEAEVEIKDAERLIKDLPSNWFVSPRDAFPGYATLGDDADRLGSVAKVFPLFFFLVAALVCLTTMTRMVEEERIQIGTLKALGYKTTTIASKYLIYALLASFIGSVV
ncbi:MAG: hypothetical protein GX829_11575, partial [Clostridium sp.]|nr:hypothetical protein [Clostridium sp.]